MYGFSQPISTGRPIPGRGLRIAGPPLPSMTAGGSGMYGDHHDSPSPHDPSEAAALQDNPTGPHSTERREETRPTNKVY